MKIMIILLILLILTGCVIMSISCFYNLKGEAFCMARGYVGGTGNSQTAICYEEVFIPWGDK